jgi:hypothetical protein
MSEQKTPSKFITGIPVLDQISFPVFYSRGQIFDQNNKRVCSLPNMDNGSEPTQLGEFIEACINKNFIKKK